MSLNCENKQSVACCAGARARLFAGHLGLRRCVFVGTAVPARGSSVRALLARGLGVACLQPARYLLSFAHALGPFLLLYA